MTDVAQDFSEKRIIFFLSAAGVSEDCKCCIQNSLSDLRIILRGISLIQKRYFSQEGL